MALTGSIWLKYFVMKDILLLPACESVGKRLHSQTGVPHRILVVEDNSDIRHINAEALRRSGYRVDTAEDVEAGWEALYPVTNSPDHYRLLITDHNMPCLSGLDLISRLRNVRMDLPVIIATWFITEDDLLKQPWLGTATVLMKPYRIDELLDAASDVLHASSVERDPLMQSPNKINHYCPVLNR